MKSRNRFFQTVRPSQTGMENGKGWGRTEGDNIFRWSFPLDFTNEMVKVNQTSRDGSNGHPVHAS